MIFIDSHKWVWRTAPREVRCKLLSSKSCTFSWCYVKGSWKNWTICTGWESNITGEVYQNILEEHLLPFIESLDDSKLWIFQDDNTRPHRTAAVDQFKDNLFLGLHKSRAQPYRAFVGWNRKKSEKLPRNMDELFAALQKSGILD